MREMKDSGIEWIGEIPADWTLQRGKTIFAQRLTKGNQSEILLAATQKYGMLPQSEVEGVVQVKEDADLQQFRTVHKKDFVISLRSFQGGFEYSQYEGVCSPAYQVFYNTNPICHNYYRLLFKSDGFIQKMNSMTVGIREGKNIQYSDFANSLIPVPPINQQQRIADYLDRKCSQIDTIIARQQEVIEKLKAYKLSVITEAVTKGLNPDVPMKDSRVEWIGEVPGNWTKVKLKNICQFINGDRSSNYPSPNEYVDNGIPFLGADSLCGRYVDVTQSKKITKEKYHSMGGAKIQKWDILYTLRGSTIGKNAIATFDEGTVASSLMVIRPISLTPEYLLYWLNSEEEFQQRQSYINGSTAPNLSPENVGSFVMFLPPALEQRKIADYLDTKCAEIELTMLKKQVLIDQLGNYKNSLIYEVVTGKKEV